MTYRPYSEIKSAGIESDLYTNNTGVSIPKGTPVRLTSNNFIEFIDVSDEDECFQYAGVTSSDCDDGQQTGITLLGRVTNVNAPTLNFDDDLYVSKTGYLTNVKPDVDVGGFVKDDFIIKVGKLKPNKTNPLLKDILILPNSGIVGQL